MVRDPRDVRQWREIMGEGTDSVVEKRTVAMRMAQGRADAYEAGAFSGGKAPFGLRYDRGLRCLVEVPAEAEEVRRFLRRVSETTVYQAASELEWVPGGAAVCFGATLVVVSWGAVAEAVSG